MVSQKYNEWLAQMYEKMLGACSRQSNYSPLEKRDHSELDTSKLLDHHGIEQYQSILDSLQWAITLGCFNIAKAIMSKLLYSP